MAARFARAAQSTRGAFFTSVAIRMAGWATWIPVAIAFNTFIAEITFVRGGSMYPFLNEDMNSTLVRDVALNFKLGARDDLARGMVVTFREPYAASVYGLSSRRSPYSPEKVSVKRIVGLEGDLVETRSPYPIPYVRVPRGHIWVEGDAGTSDKSLDSNTYGPISAQLITGRLTHILYPLRKLGRIRWWEHEKRNSS